MKERPIIIGVVTGQPSKKGQRLRSSDGLTWKQRNREAVNARRRNLYAEDPEKHRERQRQYKRGAAKPNVLAYNRKWSIDYRSNLRREMLIAYGSCCSCCGELEPLFLHLDHIHNDGHLDRKSHKTSAKLLSSLKKSGWPKDRHQLLCANCNHGKAMNGGVCPHKTKEIPNE